MRQPCEQRQRRERSAPRTYRPVDAQVRARTAQSAGPVLVISLTLSLSLCPLSLNTLLLFMCSGQTE